MCGMASLSAFSIMDVHSEKEPRFHLRVKTPQYSRYGNNNQRRLSVNPMFLSLFPRLHSSHNVCKFSNLLEPPFEKGRIWSICNFVPKSVAGLLPQKIHLKLSLLRTCNLTLRGIVLAFDIFVLFFVGVIDLVFSV